MNKKIMLTTSFVALLALAAWGYFYINRKIANAALQQITLAETTNAVVIQDYAFNPANIRIKKGDTVTWKNEDILAHKISSDIFVSDDLVNNDTYQYTFETIGTFDYGCIMHPALKGMVIVENKL